MSEKIVKEKEVLIQVSPTVRISRFNDLNLIVESLETIPESNVKGKNYPSREDWAFKGYYSTKIQALEGIIHTGLIDDEKENLEIIDYVEQVKESNRYILAELRKILD